MVAPFTHFPNSRCAVRIPGNGPNTTGKSLLADLSAVSPLAGMAIGRNPLTQSCLDAGTAHASVFSKRQETKMEKTSSAMYESSQVKREQSTQSAGNEASNTTTQSRRRTDGGELLSGARSRKRTRPEQEEPKSPSKRIRTEDASSSTDKPQPKNTTLAMPTPTSISIAQQGALQKPRAVVKPTIKSAKLTTGNPPPMRSVPTEQRTNNSLVLPFAYGNSTGIPSSSTLTSSPSVSILPPIQLQPTSAAAVKSAQHLIQEMYQLRQENETLKQKVSLFQQIFKNKDRLKSVLTGLGLRVVE